MSTLKSPTAHADEAQAALRALAHATRQIDDPSEIYAVLGALSQAAASLSQSLHQIGSFHDRRIRAATGTLGAPVQAGMTYRASWNLHKAAEMTTAVAKAIDSAHEAEATMVYRPRDLASRPSAPTHGTDGMSL